MEFCPRRYNLICCLAIYDILVILSARTLVRDKWLGQQKPLGVVMAIGLFVERHFVASKLIGAGSAAVGVSSIGILVVLESIA